MIGRKRKNNRAARAARRFIACFDVVYQTKKCEFPNSESFILHIYFNRASTNSTYFAAFSLNNTECK